MENSKISWALIGTRSKTTGKQLSHEQVESMMSEAFSEGRIFKLFLCGEVINKEGSLKEMEEGYTLVKTSMSSYEEGNYCIISEHEDGDLLLIPVEVDSTQEPEYLE